MTQLKRNVPGYIDEQGRFRPIRKAAFVGRNKRKATIKDRKKYSRAKAGDLGKARQQRALEDVFAREIRLRKESRAAKERLMKKIERESLGDQSSSGKGQTLVEFVRSSGGIRPTYKFGGKKNRGKRISYDFGELEPLTYKQSGKRGLVSEKGKYTIDDMFKHARESGYAVTDLWDLVSAMEDEIKSGKAMYANHGYLDYRDNPSAAYILTIYDRNKKVRSVHVIDAVTRKPIAKYKTLAGAKRFAASKGIRLEINPKRSSASRLAKAAISVFDNDLDLDVDAKDLKRLQDATRRLGPSRRKKITRKINPIGWFRDVSPVTPEAVKKLYRILAAKYHPDKGGDTRTMQEINADYDKAMKVAISGEDNQARAKAETSAIKPLREAIEFAVTLPDDVKVVIRGLWLWLEGNTYKAKDQIKSFKSSDGNRFKWASQKKAWFFAAVPSRNRRGEMSFEEIDQLHGHQDVTERRRRPSLNPIDPIAAFAGITGGVASALQIKAMLNQPKRRTNAKRKRNGKTQAKRSKAAKNPRRSRPPRSRLFEKFQGRPVTKAKAMPVSVHAPARLAQLGDLIELKLADGQVLKPNPKRFKLCAANGKLWIVGGKFAKPNPAAKTNEINPIARISHVVYGTRKPHHGDHKYTHYIHRLGEDSGKRPLLAVDRDGFPIIRGGNYKIEARGIVD